MDPYLKLLSQMKKHKFKVPVRSAEVPVTQRMLFGVRDELKSDLKVLKSEFNQRFLSIETQLHKMESHLHQIKILVEEQNARNIYVLDGLTFLSDRQERLEDRQTRLEKRPLK